MRKNPSYTDVLLCYFVTFCWGMTMRIAAVNISPKREIVTGDSRDKIPTKWTKNEKKCKKMKKIAKKFGKHKFFIVSLQSRSVIGAHR